MSLPTEPIYEWEDEKQSLATKAHLTRRKWDLGQNSTESAITPFSPIKILTRSLRTIFETSSDVKAVFINEEKGQYHIFVLIDHEQYNREAIHALLDKEFRFRRSHVGLSFEFDYLPLLGRKIKEITPATAKPALWR